jgi:methylenetetrahydrofolate dehydrogenase (NADP+)/methenyltetrahydrofolate cyclohydrolase
MPAQVIPGNEIAQRIRAHAASEAQSLAAGKKTVKLVSVQVGAHPSSAVYIKAQERACTKAGFGYELLTLPPDAGEQSIRDAISRLNADPTVTGIILQLPLPAGIDVRKIQAAIAPVKDVEGVHPANMGTIVYGRPVLAPCTALAVMECFAFTGADPRGREVVMVGHSDIVGKPVALLFLDRFATVTVCHIGTSERGHLEEHVRRAEILIVAVGKANLIPGAWVREGAIVIDVGINRVGDAIVGDVEYAQACERASFITPVPGGVGAVTTAMLLRNLVAAARLQSESAC